MTQHQEHPHISIIVPFLNSGRYVAQCVGALLEQSDLERKYKVIMVDNNSTDGSAEVVRQHPRIQLLREQRPGAYAARNRGLRAAKGRVIA
jgi:glycosyltransferase involved in cell wall biosynthesis